MGNFVVKEVTDIACGESNIAHRAINNESTKAVTIYGKNKMCRDKIDTGHCDCNKKRSGVRYNLESSYSLNSSLIDSNDFDPSSYDTDESCRRSKVSNWDRYFDDDEECKSVSDEREECESDSPKMILDEHNCVDIHAPNIHNIREHNCGDELTLDEHKSLDIRGYIESVETNIANFMDCHQS